VALALLPFDSNEVALLPSDSNVALLPFDFNGVALLPSDFRPNHFDMIASNTRTPRFRSSEPRLKFRNDVFDERCMFDFTKIL
jgi:hypothetical protein